MLRALWFVIKVGIFVSAAVWVANRPGSVEFTWLEYDVKAHLGLILVSLLIGLYLILVFYRGLLALFNIPKHMKRQAAEKKRQKGMRSLTLGVSAIAAGDKDAAFHYSQKARSLLPNDRGLSILLSAQAAMLQGNESQAQDYYHQLLENKDTAFLGLRGLLQNAIETADIPKASDYAYQALKLYPKQSWTLHMVYDLELKQKNWDKAGKILLKLGRHKIYDAGKMLADQSALAMEQADEANIKGQHNVELARLKQAHRRNPAFVPLAHRLAALYIKRDKRRSAVHVIEKTWAVQPHRDLVPLWRDLMPKKSQKSDVARLQWFERLASLNDNHVESQLALAGQALDVNLWGAAQNYLEKAERIEPCGRIYSLWSDLEQKQGDSDKAYTMRVKAADAPAEKVWICKQTGRIYNEWSAIARPHGSFNTIVWGHAGDYPAHNKTGRNIQSNSTALMIA